jgi:hypothetical protein
MSKLKDLIVAFAPYTAGLVTTWAVVGFVNGGPNPGWIAFFVIYVVGLFYVFHIADEFKKVQELRSHRDYANISRYVKAVLWVGIWFYVLAAWPFWPVILVYRARRRNTPVPKLAQAS